MRYFPHFIAEQKSHQLYQSLMQQINWRQDTITLYGKSFLVPRLQAWFGDKGTSYSYSNLTLEPEPWLPDLLTLKIRIEEKMSVNFNAVLINFYRNEHDSVAWHSDDEPELGDNPFIASLSLGGSRDFKLKHKITGAKLTVPLKSGSLLTMSGQTQDYWSHCIAKSKIAKHGRINLTFRQIKT